VTPETHDKRCVNEEKWRRKRQLQCICISSLNFKLKEDVGYHSSKRDMNRDVLACIENKKKINFVHMPNSICYSYPVLVSYCSCFLQSNYIFHIVLLIDIVIRFKHEPLARATGQPCLTY